MRTVEPTLISARTVSRLVICLVIGVLVAGCGAKRSVPYLSASAARRLQNDLTAVRVAAGQHKPQTADAALARFAAGVRRAAHDGQLSQAQERQLEVGVAQARRQVGLDVTVPTPPPSTETQTTPAPGPPASTPKPNPGKGPRSVPPGHARHGDHGHQHGEGDG